MTSDQQELVDKESFHHHLPKKEHDWNPLGWEYPSHLDSLTHKLVSIPLIDIWVWLDHIFSIESNAKLY